jgi:hypothetical protein
MDFFKVRIQKSQAFIDELSQTENRRMQNKREPKNDNKQNIEKGLG